MGFSQPNFSRSTVPKADYRPALSPDLRPESRPESRPELGSELEPAADWSNRQVVTVIGAIAAAALVPGFFSLQALAQDMFSDVPADHWAQPFITTLAQQGILAGYPDGTFRPEAAIDRDEYAAVIRQAFNTNPERNLASASTLGDVPEGYWAAPAIEEAYEMGFMDLPATNQFNPQTEVSRVEAIAALVQGLELTGPSPIAIPTAVEAQPEVIQSQEVQPRRGTPFHLAIPMASTELMKAFAPPAPAPVALASQPTAARSDTTLSQVESGPPSVDLSQYYADAAQIPAEVADEIALATRLGLVVNYPNVALLNPNQPMSRASTAALIHQTLVYQDRLAPLPETSTTSPYLVAPETMTP